MRMGCAGILMLLAMTDEAVTAPLKLALGTLPPYNCAATAPPCLNNLLIEQLAMTSNIAITVELVPYARVAHMLRQQQTDLLLLLRNEQLNHDATELGTAYPLQLAVLVRTDRAHWPAATLALGVLRGQGPNILQQVAQFRQVDLRDYQQGVDMLAHDRLDALLGPPAALWLLLAEQGIDARMQPVPLLSFQVEVALYCRHQACSVSQQQALQRALAALRPQVLTQLPIWPPPQQPAAVTERLLQQ